MDKIKHIIGAETMVIRGRLGWWSIWAPKSLSATDPTICAPVILQWSSPVLNWGHLRVIVPGILTPAKLVCPDHMFIFR